jgi:GNAT superfamily N-acetyltransferase
MEKRKSGEPASRAAAKAQAAIDAGYFQRAPVLSDSDELGQVQVAVWQEAYPGMVNQDYLDSLTVESSARLWTELLGPDSPRPAARFIAVAPDGSIAGIAASGASRSDHVVQAEELYDLEVLRGHRGSGVADLLIRSAVGDRPAELWVLERNLRARAFYEHHGFAANGDIDGVPDLGIVEIRMARD